ncbi:MAG: short-chain dehydrogenase [Gammaproteobacteria bacterium]|nr:short-chain dehydrogenase [Gammaproteobacteria bacterium]
MKEKKSICITGGANGMGLETARYFSRKGWLVGLLDRDESTLKEVSTAFDINSVFTAVIDVTRAEDLNNAMEEFSVFTGGRMDIMFNNAGIAPGGWFDEMSLDEMRQILEVNVMGVFNSIRAALPLLKATPNSLCLSTSSSCATFGHARRAVYTASKFAVKGLTEALSLEFERFGIRTADILPGCIDTPLLRRETAKGAGRPFDESMLENLPQEGAYRLMPAISIAEAAWSAYEDSQPIHFYVPPEVGNTDKIKATDIGAAREEIRNFLFR